MTASVRCSRPALSGASSTASIPRPHTLCAPFPIPFSPPHAPCCFNPCTLHREAVWVCTLCAAVSLPLGSAPTRMAPAWPAACAQVPNGIARAPCRISHCTLQSSVPSAPSLLFFSPSHTVAQLCGIPHTTHVFSSAGRPLMLSSHVSARIFLSNRACRIPTNGPSCKSRAVLWDRDETGGAGGQCARLAHAASPA